MQLGNVLSMIADIIIIVIDVLVRKKKKKNFKAYYGFRVLYVFPFPSVGH